MPAPHTTEQPPDEVTAEPRFSVAGTFVEALAARNFTHLTTTLGDEVVLRALLPPGLSVYEGPDAVTDAFRGWFGGASRFELLDTAIGEVRDRLLLRWRAQVDTADGRFVIEQQAYADNAPDGRIRRLDLLCSGFRPVPTDG